MAIEGEPCFTLHRVRGQRVLEAAEVLALLQCLPECTGQAGVVALLGAVLHDLQGLRRLDRFDAQPSIAVTEIFCDFVRRVGPGNEQKFSGFEMEPMAAHN